MASYKDIIPKFNPYIQQRPVEAMMKVGVYKQQRYDQGVQKIQESIDNIAGLDVVRDVDRQYLESKLNQLGGQLSMVAGGDFSNFQLVNSVNGMTNQIAKDPNVINAVGSAARYRKALENKDKLIQEGKGSASNDWLFNNEANEWLNSDDINSQYNGMYRPYKDYNKSARDIIKALGKKETGYDVAFDENGNMVDAITRVKITGISPERIRTALKQGLSPDDYQQLQVDGQYKYSNTSPSQYVNDINSNYQSTFEKYSQERDRLVALKNAASSATEQQRLQQQIEQIDGAIESVKSEYNTVSSGFESGNVAGSQAQLYTMNWLEDTANAYATESVIKSYQTNPMAQMQLRRDQMRQDAEIAEDKLTETKRYNNERLRIEEEKLNLAKDPYGPVQLPTNKDATNVEVIAAMETNRDKTKNSADALKNNYQNKYKDKDGNPLSDEGFQAELIAYATNPNSVSWDRREQLDQYVRQQKQLAVENDIIMRANAEADQLYQDKFLAQIPEQYRGDTINGYNYAQAAALFNRFDKEYYTPTTFRQGKDALGFADPVATYESLNEQKAEQDYMNNRLSDEEYGLYQVWAGANGSRLYRENVDASLKNTVDLINDISNQSIKQIEEDRQKYIKDYYQQNYAIGQEQAYRVPLEDAKQKDAFRPVLNSLAEVAERSGGLPGFEKDAETIRAIAADLQGAMVITDSQGNYRINATTTKGTSINIPINQETYDSVFRGRFEASPAVSAFQQMYQPKMLSTPSPLFETKDKQGNTIYAKTPTSYYSTSIDGEYNTTLNNAYLSGPTDFPNVSYYGVSGNIVSDMKPTDSDSFKIQLNVYDPVTQKLVLENYLFPARIDKASLVPTLQQISDEAIWQLINNTEKEMPTSELKKLQDASQTMQ
jgi:hypothetical protein